jgi:hypothetical protein
VSTDNSEAQRHLHQGRKHKFGKNPAWKLNLFFRP